MEENLYGSCFLGCACHGDGKSGWLSCISCIAPDEIHRNTMLIHQCFSSYVDKALGPRGFSSSGTQLSQKPIMRRLPCMWDSIAIDHLESSLCQNASTPLITDLINMQNMCGIGSEWLRCATTHPPLPPAAPFGGSSTAHFADLDAAPGERCGRKTWESPRP